ncbi:hypothetical protein IFM89_002275 [Coptis chinensis]|uniref:Chlorophyllase n=1 Tax=Coptis chinensis TaxID=261450 RepID=A0A835M495_9MAGN|nr:hypothetical protein IFM89_002275 [Coptis chinensis]
MATILANKFNIKLTSNDSVFEAGPFNIAKQKVETSDLSSPPKELLVITPTEKGEYPVIVFLHGFALSTSFYTELLKRIASHGYIVIAPQLYFLVPNSLPSDGYEEMKSTAEVTDWLSEGLKSILPEHVQANLLKLALIGHSRGGKTAFSLALDRGETWRKFSVLIGIDPVAGTGLLGQVKPDILTNVPRSLNFGVPVMIIGTGLGDVKLDGLAPACAPVGMNHNEFYYESQPPCYHLVTKDYGHMDMLDDNLDLLGKLEVCVCTSGKGTKDPMRRSVGGLVVAFLENYLDGMSVDLEAILQNPDIAPATLSPVEYVKS